MKREWWIALRALVVMTLLTGALYPLFVSGLAQALFPYEANGSLVRENGRVIGSELIGQSFSQPQHFHGRPSATADGPYHVLASSGSNLGPTNPSLVTTIGKHLDELRRSDPTPHASIPVDLVTASASGLDPDISLAAALYQVPRVAKARGMEEAALRQFVLAKALTNEYLILGVPRVNVLQLNRALDALTRSEP